MKKILYFLYFFTLSTHAARLDVNFRVTPYYGGNDASFRVCLTNYHKLGKHICGSSYTERHYTDKTRTPQVFYVEWPSRNVLVWKGALPEGVKVVNIPRMNDYSTPRSPGLQYIPKGVNGTVSITAMNAVYVDWVCHLYDVQINDNSK